MRDGATRRARGELQRVLVLCRAFPKLSETFVLGETLALQQAGMDVHVVALQRPPPDPSAPAPHAQAAGLQHAPAYLDVGLRALARQLPWLLGCALSLLRRPADARAARHLVRDLPAGLDAPRPWRTALWVAANCRRHRVEHIHAHYIAETAWLAAIAARLLGVPFSISAHAKDIYLGEPATLRRLLAEAAFTATCTGYNARHLRALADDPARVRCIHHGVDLERFAPVGQCTRDALRGDGEAPLLLAVGRFREKKGFDLLIDACAQLHAAGVRLQCEIVGYGEAGTALQARIAQHGLAEVVRLLPPEPHQALVHRLARASVFALPCRIARDGDRDGIPNVVLEAMAMALPVVSTTVSGIPEVLQHAQNGLLVPADDAGSLAQAIGTLLGDDGLRARLGAAARRSVQARFAWPVAARALQRAMARAPATADDDAREGGESVTTPLEEAGQR